LNQLVTDGTVLHLGHSNFTAEQAVEADAVAREHGWAAFVSAQNEYSLLNRGAELDLLPTASELGLGFLPYFPLYNGLLTGKYSAAGGEGRLTRLKTEVLEGVDWERLEAYRALCDEAGLSMLEASIGWLLAQRPVASVIAGATRPEQVRQNAAVTQVDAGLADRIGALFGR
jgi:aryl-alcohol dehydrogenase-like predicted oxidoreductase